jgi:phenylacetate-CoA ligase
VITGAENVLEFQRREIAAFTGAILTDQYGCSEGCGNASHCANLVYHEDSEFGILESRERAPGDPVKDILCTGFASNGFPFIRYEVGDSAVWQERPCVCGRHSRVLSSIEGRKDDYVITPEGGRIMRFDYIFKDSLNVKEAQIVQRRLGEIVLRVVKRPAYCTGDEEHIRKQVERWVSPAMKIDFEYISEIERERNGKFRAVISSLSDSHSAE